MTLVLLMDDLAEHLRKVNKEYFLSDDRRSLPPLKVYAGALPLRDSRQEEKTPTIEVTVIKSTDSERDFSGGQTLVTVRLYFKTYSEDLQDGWREIYNFVEHNRIALLKERLIANKYRLILPCDCDFPEAAEQPAPHYVGYLSAQFEIMQPKEELFNYGYKFDD